MGPNTSQAYAYGKMNVIKKRKSDIRTPYLYFELKCDQNCTFPSVTLLRIGKQHLNKQLYETRTLCRTFLLAPSTEQEKQLLHSFKRLKILPPTS